MNSFLLSLPENSVLPTKVISKIQSDRKYWWIRSFEGEFFDVDKLEGDKPFCQSVSLSTGYYTIGVGTPKNNIRYDFRVGYDKINFQYFSYNEQLADIIVA